MWIDTSLKCESVSRSSVIERCAFDKDQLIEFVIPASVESLGESCFLRCGSLTSLIFEPESQLSQIGQIELNLRGLIDIIFVASVEVLVKYCRVGCRSLTSLTFESESRLSRIEGNKLKQIILIGNWSFSISRQDNPIKGRCLIGMDDARP
jgi:hypothetical protein